DQDGDHTFTVVVSDGQGGSDSEEITVTVGEVNAAPVLASIGDITINEHVELTFTATADDDDLVDGIANPLSYSLTGAPTGASITEGGEFSWTPGEDQDG